MVGAVLSFCAALETSTRFKRRLMYVRISYGIVSLLGRSCRFVQRYITQTPIKSGHMFIQISYGIVSLFGQFWRFVQRYITPTLFKRGHMYITSQKWHCLAVLSRRGASLWQLMQLQEISTSHITS